MQRRINMETSSLIVLLSILTILFQYGAYYFIAPPMLILLISCVITLTCTHVLLEQSTVYETSFVYIGLITFIGLIITVLSYSSKEGSLLPYSSTMLVILAINWIIPVTHCFLRNMLDYGTRIDGYLTFNLSTGIVFNLFYLGLIIYGSFTAKGYPWTYITVINSANFTPFMSVSILIEDFLMDLIPLKEIFIYLANRIIIFIPYGYYVTMLLRRHNRLYKIIAIFIFPLIIEILQFFTYRQRSDVDDIIYALLAGLLGNILYNVINIIYRIISGRDFLEEETNSRFSGTTLHF